MQSLLWKAQDVTMFDTFAVSLQALQPKLDDVWYRTSFFTRFACGRLIQSKYAHPSIDSIDIIMNNIENKYYQQTKEIYVLTGARQFV